MVTTQLYDLVKTIYYKTIGFDSRSPETMKQSLLSYDITTLQTIYEFGVIIESINENVLIYEGFDRAAINMILAEGEKSGKQYIDIVKKFTTLLGFEVNYKIEGKANPFYNLYDTIYRLIAENNKAYSDLGDSNSASYVCLPLNPSLEHDHGISIIASLYLLKHYIIELNTYIVFHMKFDPRFADKKVKNNE